MFSQLSGTKKNYGLYGRAIAKVLISFTNQKTATENTLYLIKNLECHFASSDMWHFKTSVDRGTKDVTSMTTRLSEINEL